MCVYIYIKRSWQWLSSLQIFIKIWSEDSHCQERLRPSAEKKS